MNYINSLIRLIDKGLSAQVMFRDGSMVTRFRPHDIIVRGSREAGVVVVRGLICTDPQAPVDHLIPVCDICAVFSEKPHEVFTVDPAFLQRNPVPRGWTTIHAQSRGAEQAR